MLHAPGDKATRMNASTPHGSPDLIFAFDGTRRLRHLSAETIPIITFTLSICTIPWRLGAKYSSSLNQAISG